MSVVYLSIALDEGNSLYVGQLVGFPDHHTQGAGFREMLENLAQSIELVDSERVEALSVYFDLNHPDPASMARKSILVAELSDKLQGAMLDEHAGAALLGVDHQTLSKVLRGMFRDITEGTLQTWINKLSPDTLICSVEVEQENDGRWLAEVLPLAAVAYGQTPMDAIASAIRSGSVTVADSDFTDMVAEAKWARKVPLLDSETDVKAKTHQPTPPTLVPKGVYRFKTYQDSGLDGRGSILTDMASLAASSFGREGHYAQLNVDGQPQEDHLVELVAPSPAGQPVGSLGVVRHVYPNSEAFQVEFQNHVGYSVETIGSNTCRAVILVNALLKRWASALSQRLDRSEDAILKDGLVATDFPGSAVRIVFQDESNLHFESAFYLGDVANRINDKTICRVAVFTEHVGYHEFCVGPKDRIDVVDGGSQFVLTDRESLRLMELLENPPPHNKEFLQARVANFAKLLNEFKPEVHGGEFPQVAVSHEVATIQEFQADPQLAAAYLGEVAGDGEPDEVSLALRRIAAAFDSLEGKGLTRDFKQTVASRVEREPAFAVALLDEAKALFLSGESAIAIGVLRTLDATRA